jgi:UDP-glucuronate 4-epimerase
MRILVTGSAGFIGFHVAQRLLAEGHDVVGVDGMTPYYDVILKQRRVALLQSNERFTSYELMLEDHEKLMAIFAEFRPEIVVHLAAQAGVRYSIENPRSYVSSNIVGSFNILEACRHYPVKHLVLASTSSAYGANEKTPFEETDKAIHPITLYAATKASTELMAHSYAHLFAIPTTAFRFFTVYGPWGRPDMAYFLFTQKILNGEPIEIFNNGDSYRDFTYVDDLVQAICLLMMKDPLLPSARQSLVLDKSDTLSPVAPYRLVNIGGGQPVRLLDFVEEIEKALGLEAVKVLKPLPPGDVPGTWASAALLEHTIQYKPTTPISIGIPAFVDWYKKHVN